MQDKDSVFGGALPPIYDQYLVPLFFAPYATDIAARLSAKPPKRILEIAAGSGVVTRELAATLPASSQIVATDLNQPMLDQAMAVGTPRPVEWKQADALNLPFDDDSFDAVACQFGVMFFPDKVKAFSETRRVLTPGGVFLFNSWDKIKTSEVADVVTDALATMFPDDPPKFMARAPHGYHDVDVIRADLAKAGFSSEAAIETIAKRSVADSARDAAIAYCQGTPLRDEIVARDSSRLEEATDVAEHALVERFGNGPVDSKIQAHVVTVYK